MFGSLRPLAGHALPAMCSLVLGMRISFQVRTLTTFSPSLAKGFVSSPSSVGCACDLRSYLEKRTPKFQSLRSGAPGRESFPVNSLSSFGNVVTPDADENTWEASNDISFMGDFSVSDDDGDGYLSTLGDSSAKYDSGDGYLSTLGDSSAKYDSAELEEGALNMAIKFLEARSITVAELQKKLRARKYPPDVINSVMAYLQNRGLINDELYAESFSRSRWLTNTWGPLRIKKALIRKGLSSEDADKAITLVFKDEAQSSSDQRTFPSMSQHSMEHLLTQASKQWLRCQNKSPEKRKSSMIRWLQYRGFDWKTIMVILKKLGA